MKPINTKTACHIATAIAFVAAITANAESTTTIAKDANWSLRLPKMEKVAYKGLVNYDAAGIGNVQMLYPAPSALGFLAAVFTHGAVVESQKKSQKEKLQEEANKVLIPYDEILKGFDHNELVRRAFQKTITTGHKKLLGPDEMPGTDWLIESIPIFSLTQDQSAIVLENAIALYPPNATAPAYQNAVRVVSQTQENSDLVSLWGANGGEKLKEESASLFAHSLDIAISEAAHLQGDSGIQKTFRYQEGKTEKIERAHFISEQCGRVVIKTLRGWLMSVPARRSTSPGPCDSIANAK